VKLRNKQFKSLKKAETTKLTETLFERDLDIELSDNKKCTLRMVSLNKVNTLLEMLRILSLQPHHGNRTESG